MAIGAEQKPASSTPWIIAAIAATALLLQNVEVLHKAWRDYIGLFCSYAKGSEPVTAYSGGRDVPFPKNPECHPHPYTVRIEPTNWPRKLDVASLKFNPSEVTGRYGNGKAVDPYAAIVPEDPEVGWYTKTKSPDLIEAIVYSRTGACESRRSITGRFEVTEHNYLGW